jgi:hypothetical protein
MNPSLLRRQRYRVQLRSSGRRAPSGYIEAWLEVPGLVEASLPLARQVSVHHQGRRTELLDELDDIVARSPPPCDVCRDLLPRFSGVVAPLALSLGALWRVAELLGRGRCRRGRVGDLEARCAPYRWSGHDDGRRRPSSGHVPVLYGSDALRVEKGCVNMPTRHIVNFVQSARSCSPTVG